MCACSRCCNIIEQSLLSKLTTLISSRSHCLYYHSSRRLAVGRCGLPLAVVLAPTWTTFHELLNATGHASASGIMPLHWMWSGIGLQRKGECIGMADMGCRRHLGPGYLCRSRYRQSSWLGLDENRRDVEGVLSRTTAHRVKLPGTDQMFVPLFRTWLYSTLQLPVQNSATARFSQLAA